MLSVLRSSRNTSVKQCSIRFNSIQYSHVAQIDLSFVITTDFAWKVAVIVAISAVPLYVIKLLRKHFAPAASSKLS